MKELGLAYLGGLFDGEGGVQYHFYHHFKRSNRAATDSSVVFVNITNKDQATMDYLKSNFGGLVVVKRYDDGKRAKCYEWRLTAKQGFDFLRLIVPYLRIKRPHAVMLLSYEEQIRHRGKRTEEEKQVLRGLSDSFRELNKRGPK